MDLHSIFQRRRPILIGSVLSALGVAALYCLFATPRYMATGQIEVQKESPGSLGLDHNLNGTSADTDADALDTSMTLETEAHVLQSNTLALMVVKDLSLERTTDYFPERKKSWFSLPWMLFWRKPVEPFSVALDRAPNRRYAVLKIFASHLKVEPVAGTRLINVSYSSPDPELASDVVNRLIGSLQEYTFQSRFQATAQASAWLSGQLAGLKKQTENLQHAADKLEEGTGIYGDDASHNLVLTRLEGLNTSLAAAESNRILRQAIDEVARSGDPELISGLAGNASSGATPAMTNSLTLLQSLRSQEALVQAELDEDSARYGSAYPKVAELHEKLNGLDKSIQQEIARIGERAHTDYEISARAEDEARTSFEQQKQVANEMNDRTVAYQLAKQEADGSRDLYQGLLGKLKEAGVLEGLRSTNLTVVNAGMVPPTNRPHSPNMPLCFAAALAGGLFLGGAAALVRESTDASVRSVDDLERVLGVPLAGMIPEYGNTRWLFGREKRRWDQFPNNTALALKRPGSSSQVVLIASAVPGEGKSRLAASVAVSLASSGAKVLLVDADMLRPSLHHVFGAKAASGLAEALATGSPAVIHESEQIPGLSMVWAGEVKDSPRAGNLISSPYMDFLVEEWKSRYDFVFLDTAPVLPVPEAAGLTRFCNLTMLVVRYGSTPMKSAQRSYRALQRNMREGAELDVVMNGVPINSADYFAYYGYKGPGYAPGVGHA